MDVIRGLYVRFTEGRIARKYTRFTRSNGQTMTEYALVLAGVAVVVYSGYKTMGTAITGLLTRVDGNL